MIRFLLFVLAVYLLTGEIDVAGEEVVIEV